MPELNVSIGATNMSLTFTNIISAPRFSILSFPELLFAALYDADARHRQQRRLGELPEYRLRDMGLKGSGSSTDQPASLRNLPQW